MLQKNYYINPNPHQDKLNKTSIKKNIIIKEQKRQNTKPNKSQPRPVLSGQLTVITVGSFSFSLTFVTS